MKLSELVDAVVAELAKRGLLAKPEPEPEVAEPEPEVGPELEPDHADAIPPEPEPAPRVLDHDDFWPDGLPPGTPEHREFLRWLSS
jgi:hypothetical protein